MEPAFTNHFDIVFERVKEGSGRTRSALYVFMIANFALFLTVYGADLYRRPIERLNDFLDAVVCLKKGLPGDQKPRDDTRLICRTAIENAQFAGYDFAALNKIPLAEDNNKSMGLDDALIRKRLETLVAEEVASKRVQIPFVGFTFEIDYLWLLTSFFGPLGMIVIMACLRSELEEIRFARNYLGGADIKLRAFRARLLLSTQVLLRPNAGSTREHILQSAQRVFVHSIFLLPVLTQAIMIFYDGFIVDLFDKKFPNWGYMVDDFSAEWVGHPVIQTIWLLTVGASSLFMILSVVEFRAISAKLRAQYEEIERLGKISVEESPA